MPCMNASACCKYIHPGTTDCIHVKKWGPRQQKCRCLGVLEGSLSCWSWPLCLSTQRFGWWRVMCKRCARRRRDRRSQATAAAGSTFGQSWQDEFDSLFTDRPPTHSRNCWLQSTSAEFAFRGSLHSLEPTVQVWDGSLWPGTPVVERWPCLSMSYYLDLCFSPTVLVHQQIKCWKEPATEQIFWKFLFR